MKQSNPEFIPGNARVFVACLLSFAILITPIAAIATPRTRINPITNEKNSVPAERKDATEASLALDPVPAAVPEPAPAPPPAAPIVVATLTDNRPSVDPASAKPGDAINYTVTIQNTGDADATGVQFNQNVDIHSIYVVNSGLLVMADSYNTIGQVNINVPAPGLLANDLDISAGTNAGMTTVAQTVSSTQCAACNNVTINGDGSFTYDPKAGFTGTDTFTYAAKNAANKTAMATVQVTVAGKIWFIKNSGAAGGACSSSCDGRLSHAFPTLAAFNAANGSVGGPAAGDSVFIFESTTDYTGPVTFLNNQKFVGQDATASLISITGLTQPSGTDPLPAMNFTPATNVNITSASSAITLGQGNTLRGFTVGTTTGTKIVGNNFGTLIVGNSATPDVTLNGAGQALNLTTGTLAVTGGFVGVTSTSSTAQGINLAGIADSDGAGGSSFSFGATTISGSTTQGILIGTTTADLTFGTTSVTGGTDAISFQNNSAGTRTFASTLGATAGGAGIAINHGVGGGNVTVSGLATLTSNAGNTIDIQTQAVSTTVNFAGGATLTKTAGGTGINLVNDNGTVTFGGTLTIGTSGTRFPATAVTISGGAGPTFSTGIVNLGAVSIFTNAFAGISSLNNDGTINSTSGTVDTGAATALSIDGPAGLTTLGMTLTTVNSSGGINNISLIDDAGTLTVNGGALSAATAACFSVNAGTVSATYSGNITQAGGAALVNISAAHNTGTITFNTGTLSASNGTGLQFNNADGIYNFNGTTTLTGGSRIDILNGSSGSFGFTSGASVTNGGGTASFNVVDSNPSVAYAGTITTNALRPVSISNAVVAACGTQTFSGAIGSTGNGILVNNCNAGTITFSAAKTLNTATNTAVTLTTNAGATINFTNGGLNIDTTTAIGFSATGGGIINVTGATNDIDATTSTALLLNGVTVGGSGMTFANVNKTTSGGAFEGINIDALAATGGGGLTVASSTIAGTTTSKAGIHIATSSAAMIFTSVTITATNGPGIELNNNTAAIAVNGGTVGAGVGMSTTGNAVDIDQGTANITVAAALTKSTSGRIVEITNRTGTSTIDITGSLNCTSACTGINVKDILAGASTINFSNGTKTLDTTGGAGAGVTLDNIDNATVNFSNGGLNIDTSTGVGFDAKNGAIAINVTGSGNTINSTSATALSVVSSTIGANNLNFHDISAGNNTAAADPANGIVLNNTGSGRLIVAGDGNATLGGNSSGGVIQHTSGHGISLTTTQNPSFVNMSIHDIGGGDGIFGTGVVNFTFDNGQVTNAGTSGADQYTQNGIAFVDPGVAQTTVSGSVVITDSLFSGIRRNAIMIETWNGTISSITINNNTFAGPTIATAVKDSNLVTTADVADAIHVFAQGSASQTANLTTGTINNNTISNFEFLSAGIFIGGNGIQVAGGSGNSSNSTVGTLGTAANPIEIANNDIDNVGKNSIIASFNGQQGVSNFNIHNNGTVANPMSNAEGLGISVFFGGSGTFSSLVNNNAIDNNGPTVNAGSAGIGVQLDDGPAALANSTGNAAITVNGNTVTNPDGFGIRGIVRASLGNLNLKVQNNNVGIPSASNRNAIRIDSGSGAGDTTLCLNISGNSGPLASSTDLLVGSGVNAGIMVRKQGTIAATNEFNLQNISPANPSNAQVTAFVGMPVPPGLNFAAAAGGGAGTNANGNGVDINGSNYGTCTTAAQFKLEKPTDVFLASIAKPESGNADTPFVTESADSLLAFSNVKVDHTEILNDFNRSLNLHSGAVDANVGQQTVLAQATVEASVGQQPVLLNASVEASISQPAPLNASVEASSGQRATLANVRVEAERGPAPVVPPSLIARAAASLSRVANSFDSLIVTSAHAEESSASKQTSASSKRSDVRLNHARSARTNRAATTSNALAPVPVGCSAAPGTICVNVGVLHPGDSVQIGFSVTVNNPPNLTLLTPSPHISTQGAISGGNFATVQTNDPDTVAAGDPTDTPIDLFDVSVGLASSLNPSTPTDAVTYTATITVPAQVPAPLGGANPSSGTVTFKDNNATISGACTNVALSGSGPWTAQCTVPAGTYTGATSHPITATYNGNGNFDQNTSSILTQTVLQCTNVVTVTNTGDNGGVDPAFGAGTGTLRQAIVDVCPGGTINFNIPGGGPDTITLGAGLILSKDLTINGPTAKTTIINGAGLYRVFSVGSGKTVKISNLQMTNGSASATGGAGILNSGTLTLKNSTVSGNATTGVDGGGIRNEGTLTVISSTISGNTSTNDGGGISQSATATSMTLINTTISGNNAAGSGGGVDVLGGTMTSINSTITGNRADSDNNTVGTGGGLRRQGGTATLHNTIVAGNFNEGGAVDPPDDIAGTVDAASSFNLIGDSATAGGLTNGTNNNIVGNAGAGTIDITTVLNTTLANNGGPTQTHALVGTGPAVEAGSNANLPADTLDLDGDADTAETLPVDQRGVGFPRVADSADTDTTQTVDIGAYEAHPTVEDITTKTTAEDTALPGFVFNVGDGTGALITAPVTAVSNNTTVVPNLPANLSVTGAGATRTLSITPVSNTNTAADGPVVITVTVTATNGQTAQDTFSFVVTEVNDAPVPTNDSLTAVDEDSGQRIIPFADLLGNDINKGAPNETGQTLTVSNVSNPSGGTVILDTPNSRVLFTPAADFNGTASFDYQVTDNGTTNLASDPKSGTATASFTVNAVNDPPSFTIAANPGAVNEDAGAQTVPSFATSISQGPGESGQLPLTFNITPGVTTGNISFASGPAINATTGNLTYTTNADTNGTATFSVTLSDSGSNAPPNSNTSPAQTFTITVNAVDDAPNFLLGSNPTRNEDAGLQTLPGFANSFQPGPITATDEGTQTLVGYTVTQTGGTLTFSSAPAIDNSGTLTFTSALNSNGTATFDVVATDTGSNVAPNVNQSGPTSFTITVNPINDAPSFTKGGDQTISKNAGAQTVPGWATAISAGPPDEVTAGQTVSFNVSVTGTTGSLTFTSPPAVNSSGTLTYTATNGTSGVATVDVTAVDSGLGAGTPPNENESAPQTFTITVTGVNVAPVNTVPATVSMPQDTVYTFTGSAISVADVDAADAPGDNVISVALNATNGTMNLSGTAGLTFTGGSDGSAAMTVEGTIPDLNAALNNMRFTPTAGYTGSASIQMVSNDLGKTGTGGAQTDDDTININVTAGTALYINEVLFNPPGADAPNEYIEIRGAANTTIPAGTYLVAIEGDAADNPGDVRTIINLTGLNFGANGFLVLLQNGNTYTTDAGATVLTSTTAGFSGLPGVPFQADAGATDVEDASITFMLIQTGAAPSLTDDIDVNDDGATDGFVFAGWNVRDSISAMNGTANARAYGAFSFRNSAGTGTSVGPEVIVNFIPSYVGRNGDSTGSTAADWVASGVLGGAAPNWTLGVAAETEPASFAGKPLNHIGASNFGNLAPVNSVPAATQNVNEDEVLTFNAGNANLISISDPDAGGADVKVTLTATNGTMSLSGTAGLSFTINDGVNDAQMSFTGTIANINTALNGMTFTPALNYSGGATIQIVTDDQGNVGVGGAKTDTDTVNINVNAVNDPPTFTLAGNPAAVNEDAGAQTVNGFASSISQGPGESGQTLTFNVTPTGAPLGNITFASGPAIDATTGNLTYTTNADTNGSATFNVTLSDNGSNVSPNSNTSGVQQFTITVNAVNDAPSFLIPSNPPSVNEDAGAQTVNSFTTSFQPGPPAATDEIGQTVVGYAVTPTGTTGNLTFASAPSISNAGTLTYTPTGDTSGTATFNVVATDSGSGSAPNVNQSAAVSFTITVNGQNDAPVMDNSGNMSLAAINEDVPNASNPGTLVSDVILSAGGDRITDIDAGAVEGIAVFAVNNANGTWQYSIDNGTNWLPFGTPDALNSRLLASNANTRVRFIPNLNFNGTVDPGLTFRAWDQTSGVNGNTADTSVPGGITAFSTATETASITVNPDNDTPTTTGIPAVTVNEDAANTVLNLRANFNDVEDGNDLAYTVTANTNPSLFSSVSINNANDNLTLAYAANAFGSAQITIRGTDVGGLFVESTFTVTVNSSNDPPSFTKGPDQTTFQNSGPQTVANWATNMSTGPADESGQTLTFNVTANTNAALFSAPPAINATTGTLTYTGANNASGNATITITLSDNGGTANGGNDTSAPQTFVITINPCTNPATVTNTSDSGVGSLRDAIANLCAGGTINFDPALNGQTITLTSGELAISKNLTITGPGANLLTISGNNAGRVFNIQAGQTATISGLRITNGNSASDGGAIVNSGTLGLTECAVTSSSSPGSGGGVVNTTGATMTITGSTLTGNTAPVGAGVANGGGLTILNSTISANNGRGFTNSAGTATIINSTISGNTDAGIEAVATVSVGNTIVANAQNNTADVEGTFTSQGNNLIGDKGSSTGFTNGVNGDQVGTGGALVNPLLGALANNGGPTQTHALLPGSPAINAGSNILANSVTLTTDQRGTGFNRIVNTTVDIGAFESRGFTISVTSGTPQSAVFNTAFGAPLVATVSSASGEPVNGGQVVFTAPGSGASATFTGGVTTIASVINAGGQASASATANATVGSPYNVTAAGNGVTGTATFNLTNNQANQTINFGALANKTFGDPDFGVSATSTSGLAVTFAPSGNCTVTSPSPGTVHITGAGSCTITASQGGNANYSAAPDVARSFTIAKAATNTALSSSVNPSDFNQSVTFTATVASAAGTPTGTVQFKDNGNNLGAPVALNASGGAQLSTSTLTTGTHTITADYSGDANFTVSTGTLSGGQVVKAQPSLSINDVSVTEGNAGTKLLNFTVTLSAANNLAVSVDYATSNGTATAPSDYAAIASTLLTFNPGDTSKTVSVTINGDVGFEPDETLLVNLSNAVNATISDNQGLGTIQNDDALGGFISFSQPTYNVSESIGIVTVTVTRTNDVSQAVQVDYATDDTGASINCGALNTGLASQRCDYTSMFGTLRFAANETQKTVDIPINLDAYTEGPEVFTFNLSNATGGAVVILSTATVTISDSASPTPNTTDDSASFVRQLYHDFLNRDADAAGLAFWTDNIDKCNDPARRPAGQTLAACIEVQRITTMAAFFLSIEFRQTGGMVRDFYVASLDRPLSNDMPGFVEFMRDTQAIQKGVTVGQGNWQQVLDANRLAFMNEFVMRAEFVAMYPTTDTPTQYVDKLYQHARLTQTQQERLDAIEYFGGAATAADPGARARALLLLTQNGDFQQREIRRAFVHMLYLGYLRRNPNEAPDNNFDGFNFWVTKLNQFNGDYLQAEMVKAFLSSIEYRKRFGP